MIKFFYPHHRPVLRLDAVTVTVRNNISYSCLTRHEACHVCCQEGHTATKTNRVKIINRGNSLTLVLIGTVTLSRYTMVLRRTFGPNMLYCTKHSPIHNYNKIIVSVVSTAYDRNSHLIYFK